MHIYTIAAYRCECEWSVCRKRVNKFRNEQSVNDRMLSNILKKCIKIKWISIFKIIQILMSTNINQKNRTSQCETLSSKDQDSELVTPTGE